MTDHCVDVLIIGGGVGGLTLAQWLTGLGRSWRIVEREAYLGGPLAHSQYVFEMDSGLACGVRARLYGRHCGGY
ncbi:FAD-dependent monooxygenase [Deefgea sp. CFH1-16]|uniref:FAD-dependent monooxygenase n=1 Tax=Deefgea sp. CFH1-16 TaxID=2675457 RepID=UPI001FFD99D0|nr:FAD-dependent monooxygenase [Deefgea sp. CFH1-16]